MPGRRGCSRPGPRAAQPWTAVRRQLAAAVPSSSEGACCPERSAGLPARTTAARASAALAPVVRRQDQVLLDTARKGGHVPMADSGQSGSYRSVLVVVSESAQHSYGPHRLLISRPLTLLSHTSKLPPVLSLVRSPASRDASRCARACDLRALGMFTGDNPAYSKWQPDATCALRRNPRPCASLR